MRRSIVLSLIAALTALSVLAEPVPKRKKYENRSRFIADWLKSYPVVLADAPLDAGLARKLIQSALEQTQAHIVYNPDYFKLAYPGGDVPAGFGVCTDVLIRAYRAVGDDLQVDVHEDMAAAFSAYPNLWGRDSPDANIDHRRVPNLMVFFGRHATTLPITNLAADYRPADIVAWDLGGGVTHIGMVVDKKNADASRPLIVHNIGRGPELQDALFDYKIIGHHEYVDRKRPHYVLYRELDPKYAPTQKSDPGPAFMSSLRRELSRRGLGFMD